MRARITSVIRLLAMMVALAVLAGCATATSMYGVEGTHMVKAVDCPAGTKCTLTNKKGTWMVDPPGVVAVLKSDDTLHVRCSGPDGVVATAALDPETSRTTFENFIHGGMYGVILDANTDAHRKYSSTITVRCRR